MWRRGGGNSPKQSRRCTLLSADKIISLHLTDVGNCDANTPGSSSAEIQTKRLRLKACDGTASRRVDRFAGSRNYCRLLLNKGGGGEEPKAAAFVCRNTQKMLMPFVLVVKHIRSTAVL